MAPPPRKLLPWWETPGQWYSAHLDILVERHDSRRYFDPTDPAIMRDPDYLTGCSRTVVQVYGDDIASVMHAAFEAAVEQGYPDASVLLLEHGVGEIAIPCYGTPTGSAIVYVYDHPDEYARRGYRAREYTYVSTAMREHAESVIADLIETAKLEPYEPVRVVEGQQLFDLIDTHGLPTSLALERYRDTKTGVDWIGFVSVALNRGWKRRALIAKVHEGLGDVYGPAAADMKVRFAKLVTLLDEGDG